MRWKESAPTVTHIHLRTPADGGRDLDEKTPWGTEAIYEVVLNWAGD
jgi:hypothetical protein